MNRNMALVATTYTANFIRYSMVFPLIPLLADKMGVSPFMIGIIAGSFSVVSLILAIPVGSLLNVVGVRSMLLAGVIGNAIAALMLVRASTAAGLIAAQILGGLAFQFHLMSSQTFVSRLNSSHLRERNFGFLTFGASIGQTSGPALGGLLVHSYGYTTAFWVAFGVSLAGLVAALLDDSDTSSRTTRTDFRHDLKYAGELLSDSRMLAVLSFTFMMVAAVSLRASFLPILLKNRGFTEGLVGVLVSVFAGTSLVVRPFIGKLLQYFTRRHLLAFAVAAAGIGLGLAPTLSSPLALALALGTFGIGFGLTQPLSQVMVADLTTPERSGVAMAVRFTSLTSASLFSPIVLGIVVGLAGIEASLYAAAVALVLIGGFIVGARPYLIPGRRSEPAQMLGSPGDNGN